MHKQSVVTHVCVQCNVSFVRVGRPVQLISAEGFRKTFCSIECKDSFARRNVVVCTGCGVFLEPGQLALKFIISNGEFRLFCSKKCLERNPHVISINKAQAQDCLNMENEENCLNKKSTSNKSDNSVFRQNNSLKQERNCCFQCFDEITSFDAAQPRTLQHYGNTKQFCSSFCVNEFKSKNKELCRCVSCEKRSDIFTMIEKVTKNGEIHHFCSASCQSNHIEKFTSIQSVALQKCFICKCKGITKFLVERYCLFKGFCSNTCVDKFKKNVAENRTLSHFSNNVKGEHCLASDMICSGTGSSSIHSNQPICTLDDLNLCVPKETVLSASNKPTALCSKTKISKKDVCVQVNTQVASVQIQTECKPMLSKSVQVQKMSVDTFTQTEDTGPRKSNLLPIPVPVYIPCPMKMFCDYAPFPVAVPIPVPVPVFLPTTLTNVDNIVNTIEDLKENIPSNPVEADLLAMADAVAGAESVEQENNSNFENLTASEVEEIIREGSHALDNCDDVAFQDAADICGLASIPTKQSGNVASNNIYLISDREENEEVLQPPVKRRKKGRRSHASKPKFDKPDERTLHAQYGLDLWKGWAADNIKTTAMPQTLIISDAIPVTPYELNQLLSKFCQSLKRPSGSLYRADSMFYIFLSIQKHLQDVESVSNIFTDFIFSMFENEFCKAVETRLPTSPRSWALSSRITEEHLWNCNQLGAHSPKSLLFTLIYFVTKYFMQKTADSHACLTLADILYYNSAYLKNPKGYEFKASIHKCVEAKGYKRINIDKRNNLHHEQFLYENNENLLRCPTRLLEFYLSKCPSAIRSHCNDLFYLAPEKSCIPESPVWYSTISLSADEIHRMLVRILLVKDIYSFWKNNFD